MERATYIAQEDSFAQLLGTQLVRCEQDRVVVAMPYQAAFGDNRVHGGAISGLVDIAATAAFWADEQLTEHAQGATVGFDIHFLSMAVGATLTADARVRRRGGSLCTGEVTVTAGGREVACATVTYKLSNKSSNQPRNNPTEHDG